MIRLYILISLMTLSLGDVTDEEPPSEEKKILCGYNEVYTPNKVYCPPQTCQSRYLPIPPCAPPPREPQPGCECLSNHLRNSSNICVPIKECPPPPKKIQCGYNEVYTPNKIYCPPQTCQSRYLPIPPCAPPPRVPQPGCKCLSNHLRNSSNICVPIEECPPPPKRCDDPNAQWTECTTVCPKKTCTNPNIMCEAPCQPPGCQCKPGYLLFNGKCIKPKDCPECGGDPNSEYRDCTTCQPTCDDPNPICPDVCGRGGCQCKSGYVLLNDKCILPEECPDKTLQCGYNEAYAPNKRYCQPETCESRYLPPPPCAAPPPFPQPGCECLSNHLRNSSNICVPIEECPPRCSGDPNSEYRDCTSCQPTCDNLNPICAAVCGPGGCQCKSGYVLLNGKCILPEECPVVKNCSDPNAIYKKCPNPCPPTCESPQSGGPCNKMCLFEGCECKPGYLLSNGKCIKFKDCPGAANCQANEQFVFCHGDCPTSFCPENDSRNIIMCDPPYPCPSGCSCKAGYFRKSQTDRQCIEASKCPPVKCTRPNEIWSPSPPNCLAESCEDANKPSVPCDKPYRDYTPKCICEKGFYRNSEDICVPARDCEGAIQCGYNEVYTPNKIYCPPQTCESRYLPPPPCAPPPPDPQPGCECLSNHLRNSSNICVPIDECPPPPPQPCDDPNAEWTECTTICPKTCTDPNIACRAPCQPPGCQCKEGYLLLNGKCIKPEDCPDCGGDPNSEYRDCTSCQPTCDNPNPICPAVCGPGGCQCKSGYVLSNGKCILPEECPAPECPIKRRCRPTCAVPNPRRCPAVEPATSNVDGCQCQQGYILSKAGGECVRIEDCPKQKSCNGDPNAIVTACPWACQPTCANPEAALCKATCLPVGCNCKPGYIRSTKNGKCIRPKKCPRGNPCGRNEVFVDCGYRCPHHYCPQEFVYACKPPRRCPPGCACKKHYKRLSFTNQRCVLESECPDYEYEYETSEY